MPTKPLVENNRDEIFRLYRLMGTIDGVADELGVDRKEVGPIINEMPLRQVYRRKGSPPQIYNRDFLIEVLQKAAKACGEPLTLPAYHKVAPDFGWPAALTITKEFGTWESACKAAGVKVNPSTGPRKGSITIEDCLIALRVCKSDLIEQGEIPEDGAPSYERYCKWAKENRHPSGPTIRVKVGPWREALQMAYDE